MNSFVCLSRFAATFLAVYLWALAAEGQVFNLAVSASPDVASIDETITYQIALTNVSAAGQFNIFISNTLPASVTFVSATYSHVLGAAPPTFATSGNLVLFDIGDLARGGDVVLEVTGQPAATGFITNMVTTFSSSTTNRPSTNVVTSVYSSQSDLAVGITPPSGSVYVGDSTSYQLLATNLGPASAAAARLTHTLPSAFELVSVSPASQNYTNEGGVLRFELGTLAIGQVKTIQLGIRATNSGNVQLTANVAAGAILDTNAANDSVTNSFVVSAFPTNELVVLSNFAQKLNPQTGLVEQRIILSNASPERVDAARVIVEGITSSNRLYNSVGTNSGEPFVVYAAPLDPGESAELLLEFYSVTRTLVTGLTFQGVAVAEPAIAIPNGAPFDATIRSTNSAAGLILGYLIEFPAQPGHSYTILYGDNSAGITNVAQPPIIAPANRVQWLDDGPPKTTSHPANSMSRLYQVIENP